MTMYHEKLAAAIKVNSKVLREFKDTVYLSFGSEYSIYLKNLNTVKALVNVYVDGDNIVPGGLVLNAGQEIELERSIKNGNMNVGNKLKFIERVGAIEQHRGIKLEDGLVRIEFQFEKVYKYPPSYINAVPYVYPNQPWYNDNMSWTGFGATFGSAQCSASSPLRSSMSSSSDQSSAINQMAVMCSSEIGQNAIQSETGITVAGSKSEQKFQTANWFATESETHSIILKLLGETVENKPVRTPITVKTNVTCSSCHQKSKASAAFCPRCGTSLKLFA